MAIIPDPPCVQSLSERLTSPQTKPFRKETAHLFFCLGRMPPQREVASSEQKSFIPGVSVRAVSSRAWRGLCQAR